MGARNASVPTCLKNWYARVTKRSFSLDIPFDPARQFTRNDLVRQSQKEKGTMAQSITEEILQNVVRIVNQINANGLRGMQNLLSFCGLRLLSSHLVA
jgi:hypothetical protein